MEVMEILKKIETDAAENKQEMRVIKKIQTGNGVRQGDVYLVKVPDESEVGKQLDTKLAPGENMGSRHIVEGAECFESKGIKLAGFERCILGPVVKSKKSFTVTHPEHAHIRLPAGSYQVIYQLDPRTMRRVRD